VLFICENNRYAMGTALDRTHARTDLAARAAGYGMPAVAVDGMDVLAVEAASRDAVDAIRAGEGPRFIEFETYRFRAHSMYDPERYRETAEVEEWKGRDPIRRLASRLLGDDDISQDTLDAFDAEIAREIDEAIAFAEAGTLEPVDDLTRFVLTEVPR
jgi:pyruvate dehydrogenase E1 component alpha subunit